MMTVNLLSAQYTLLFKHIINAHSVGGGIITFLFFKRLDYGSIIVFLCLTLCVFSKLGLAETVAKHHAAQPQAPAIKVDFSLVPGVASDALSAGTEAMAEFLITDPKTAKPVSGLKPLAWMVKQESNQTGKTEGNCEAQIHHLHQGHLSQQAAVNLTSFLVLTLNHDNTISIIDPQVAWSKTKLQAMVVLPSRGDDWLLDQSKKRLYVTLPEQATLAVIDTDTWHIANTIKLGNHPGSTSTALRQSGKNLWVALDDGAEVLVINTIDLKTVNRIQVKPGSHHFADSSDYRLMFVSNSSHEISVIETSTLQPVAEIPVTGRVLDIESNPFNGFIYVITENTKTVRVIDPKKMAPVAAISLEAEISQLRFSDNGRYGFAISRGSNTVSLIDASQQKTVATAQVADQPDQVVFSKHYAYVRGLAKAQYSVFDLTQVDKGILAPANVEAGQQPALSDASTLGHSDMIAPTPDGHGALLANGPDRKLYYYMEGMMAASGTLDNGGHIIRGILIADRSLMETSPGKYSVAIKLPTAGLYNIPFFVENPHFAHCYTVNLTENNKDKTAPLKVTPVAADISAKAGETVELSFSVVNEQSRPVAELNDVQVLIVETQSRRQSKRTAVYDKTGSYKVNQHFERPGHYMALVKIPSLGIDFKRTTAINISVLP